MRSACRADRHRLDLGGAEFVFRDLAEWVELRVGQDIGRRFGIAERDEHLAGRDGAVAARLQFDRATAGGNANLFAGGDAEPAQVGGGEAGGGLGLDLVEHGGTPCYGTRMPVFELAA